MRIDKYLWSIRLYKTRTLAAEEIKKGRVSVEGRTVKASKEVKEGEILQVRKNQINYQIKVLGVPKSRVGAKLVADYAKDLTDPLQYETLKLRRMEQGYYRALGEGRPTKKDRREIEDFTAHSPGIIGEENLGEDYWESFFSGEQDPQD